MPKADEPKTTIRWSAEQHAKLKALSDETGFAFAAIAKECVDRGYPDVARRLRRGDATLRQAPADVAKGEAKVTYAEDVVPDLTDTSPLGPPVLPVESNRTTEARREDASFPDVQTARDILKARSEAMRGRQP